MTGCRSLAFQDHGSARRGHVRTLRRRRRDPTLAQGGWIEVGSGQWMSGAPYLESLRWVTATGVPGSVQFVHRVAPSSSLLRRAFDSKQHFPRVQLDVPKPGQEAVYCKIVLSDVLISSFSRGDKGFPTETIKMDYGKIEWTCAEQRPPSSPQTRPTVRQ